MSRDHPDNDWQVGSGVRRKVRLFVETLLRAGLLVIPAVGSALEKAAFGIKDASATEELLSLVRTVEQTLREHAGERHVLSEAEIERLSQAILEKSVSQELMAVFEAVSDQLFLLVSEVLAEVTSHTGVLKELQRETRLAHDALLKKQDELLIGLRLQAERQDRLLSAILEQAKCLQKNPRTPPAELLSILEYPEVLRALDFAGNVIQAVSFHAERTKAIVSADFSELWSFAQGGIGGDELYPATIALFRHSRVPIFALPGTLKEILRFLWLESRGLLRISANLASGRGLKAQPTSVLLGLQSLRSAIQDDIVRPWKETRITDELRAIEMDAAQFIARRKGLRHPMSIRSDALNIACLAQIAARKPDDCEAVVFVSRDKSLGPTMRAIGKHMGSLRPQIVNPVEWAFDAFLRSDDIGETLRREALALRMFKCDISSILSKITDALRSSSADEIIGVQPKLASFIAVLSASRGSLRGFSNWLAVLAEEGSATIARSVWEHGLMEAYTEALRALTGLERYVESLARAFDPFRQGQAMSE